MNNNEPVNCEKITNILKTTDTLFPKFSSWPSQSLAASIPQSINSMKTSLRRAIISRKEYSKWAANEWNLKLLTELFDMIELDYQEKTFQTSIKSEVEDVEVQQDFKCKLSVNFWIIHLWTPVIHNSSSVYQCFVNLVLLFTRQGLTAKWRMLYLESS